MKQFCHAVIYLDKDQRTNTYCMRERGHTGEHSFNVDVPEKPAILDDLSPEEQKEVLARTRMVWGIKG